MSNSIKDSAQAFAVNQVLKYVDSNPQEAFPKLLDWADKFDKAISERTTIKNRYSYFYTMIQSERDKQRGEQP